MKLHNIAGISIWLFVIFVTTSNAFSVEFDKPQQIKYDDLFSKYLCSNVIDDADFNKKINDIFHPYKTFLQGYANAIDTKAGYSLVDIIFGLDWEAKKEFIKRAKSTDPDFMIPSYGSLSFEKTYKKMDPAWQEHWTLKDTYSGRSWTGENDQITGWIFKIFSQESSRSSMANTLRAPMASLMSQIIKTKNLHELVVPKKCLIQVYEQKIIDKMPQDMASLGFVIAVEKLDLLDKNDSIKYLSELPEVRQRKIAEEIATLITYSGLWDIAAGNMLVTKTGKVAFIDTEPLRGELILDEDLPHDEKLKENYLFMGNNSGMFRKNNTLRLSAEAGLKKFKESAVEEYKSKVFEETAEKFLERLKTLE